MITSINLPELRSNILVSSAAKAGGGTVVNKAPSIESKVITQEIQKDLTLGAFFEFITSDIYGHLLSAIEHLAAEHSPKAQLKLQESSSSGKKFTEDKFRNFVVAIKKLGAKLKKPKKRKAKKNFLNIIQDNKSLASSGIDFTI